VCPERRNARANRRNEGRQDNIKMDLLDVGARTGSIWLRTGTDGGLL